jgi:hypothetical protein
MPIWQRSQRGTEIQTELANATLESGFALVRLAESQMRRGERRDANRALREAEAARCESSGRLFGLPVSDAPGFSARVAELRGAIEAAKAGRRPRGEIARPGNVIQMPSRRAPPAFGGPGAKPGPKAIDAEKRPPAASRGLIR